MEVGFLTHRCSFARGANIQGSRLAAGTSNAIAGVIANRGQTHAVRVPPGFQSAAGALMRSRCRRSARVATRGASAQSGARCANTWIATAFCKIAGTRRRGLVAAAAAKCDAGRAMLPGPGFTSRLLAAIHDAVLALDRGAGLAADAVSGRIVLPACIAVAVAAPRPAVIIRAHRVPGQIRSEEHTSELQS